MIASAASARPAGARLSGDGTACAMSAAAMKNMPTEAIAMKAKEPRIPSTRADTSKTAPITANTTAEGGDARRTRRFSRPKIAMQPGEGTPEAAKR